ncbi:hypothetical protein BRADI_1g46835v3 [Brachypodium distachyon]|uniref:Uncharacterized protein n=1 Tax=Brachypodium distachyon TaxID=15368 RepID=A0A2K2DPU7_BRADI|nr:hypothetical protein BRADI_1g46835v3 [Brachypodium distachyon]
MVDRLSVDVFVVRQLPLSDGCWRRTSWTVEVTGGRRPPSMHEIQFRVQAHGGRRRLLPVQASKTAAARG